MRPQLLLFHWCLLALGLVVASVMDIRARRVPNWLNVGLLAAGLTARFLNMDALAVAWGLAGAGVGLVLLLYPFAKGWLGAGDVKLLTACGGWLGPILLIWAALGGSMFGGILALIYWRRSPPEVRQDIGTNLKLTFLSRHIPEADARPRALAPPYAPALALGVLGVVALELCGIHLT